MRKMRIDLFATPDEFDTTFKGVIDRFDLRVVVNPFRPTCWQSVRRDEIDSVAAALSDRFFGWYLHIEDPNLTFPTPGRSYCDLNPSTMLVIPPKQMGHVLESGSLAVIAVTDSASQTWRRVINKFKHNAMCGITSWSPDRTACGFYKSVWYTKAAMKLESDGIAMRYVNKIVRLGDHTSTSTQA